MRYRAEPRSVVGCDCSFPLSFHHMRDVEVVASEKTNAILMLLISCPGFHRSPVDDKAFKVNAKGMYINSVFIVGVAESSSPPTRLGAPL
jgi:hypothetical protein